MDFSLVDDKLKNVPTDKKINLALEMEKAARGHDNRVKKVRSSSYSDSDFSASSKSALPR